MQKNFNGGLIAAGDDKPDLGMRNDARKIKNVMSEVECSRASVIVF